MPVFVSEPLTRNNTGKVRQPNERLRMMLFVEVEFGVEFGGTRI
jgi:hypothetical protein